METLKNMYLVTGETSPANTMIVMLTNQYDGVKYYYSTVKFEEKSDDTFLSFEYHLLDNPTGEELEGNEDFGNHIGEVLVDIIEEGLKLSDSSREDDTNTSTE